VSSLLPGQRYEAIVSSIDPMESLVPRKYDVDEGVCCDFSRTFSRSQTLILRIMSGRALPKVFFLFWQVGDF